MSIGTGAQIDRKQAEAIRDAWADRHQATEFHGRKCLEKLLRPRHHCGSPKCYENGRNPLLFAVLDHFEMWKTKSGAFIAVGHPYDLHEIGVLQAWCDEHGLLLTVHPKSASWYFPNESYLVAVIGSRG